TPLALLAGLLEPLRETFFDLLLEVGEVGFVDAERKPRPLVHKLAVLVTMPDHNLAHHSHGDYLVTLLEPEEATTGRSASGLCGGDLLCHFVSGLTCLRTGRHLAPLGRLDRPRPRRFRSPRRH